ncbi:RrF2 family transcriptional regulator [Methylocystis bryophila]|uniref:Rrf2 family transcriptional regulator n=1 Tax=Methylocystis bryophila TaxID=655015 RepID=A0A1W6MSX4_9HYPH|nr:Rrf2 family transcriptional regulator [Methylocystis bryophila]ARN80723.1 Rrf2 family transcriptional regulator [Methylocystis bryophila]BDV40795.1 Rrf2 family transcriptional regulator [Methylocystis bryophila]
MTLLPRAARAALLAVLDVALHARGRPVSSKELATRHALPPRRLESLLQALVHAGVLKSLRGPSGGYELAKERRRLTLADVLRVALRVEEEGDLEPKIAPLSLEAAIAPALEEIEAEIFQRLEMVTLDDLCARALVYGFGSAEKTQADFEI